MIETADQLARKAVELANGYKTIYVLGAFGWPMKESNQDRAIRAHTFNQQTKRLTKIRECEKDTFGFDCVNMIKGLLWGWCGDEEDSYGGAVYRANGVPDTNANGMIGKCTQVSTDFSNIEVGEVVWIPGHIGIYVGDGLAVECTHRWNDGVQITAVHNLGKKHGYHGRVWKKHGKLPYVSYRPCDYVKIPRLCKDDQSQAVKALQLLLIGWGYSCGKCGADGIFGAETEKAVASYQLAKELEITKCADKDTWASLLGVR